MPGHRLDGALHGPGPSQAARHRESALPCATAPGQGPASPGRKVDAPLGGNGAPAAPPSGAPASSCRRPQLQAPGLGQAAAAPCGANPQGDMAPTPSPANCWVASGQARNSCPCSGKAGHCVQVLQPQTPGPVIVPSVVTEFQVRLPRPRSRAHLLTTLATGGRSLLGQKRPTARWAPPS